MDHIKLWQIIVCFAIALYCLASSVAQGVDECSPRCWNPVHLNYYAVDHTRQENVPSEEDCKALCLNTETCIGIDWNKNSSECWFQATPSRLFNTPNVNHWSLVNCTGECAPYCWTRVQIGEHTSPGYIQPGVADENHCKLQCSNSPNCTGIEWTGNCYLLDPAYAFATYPGERHWEIERNQSTLCQIMDECSPRCWNPVELNSGVDATTKQNGVASEEDCKTLCLNGETCIGIDWDKNNNGCWFQTTPSSPSNRPNVNHWSLANCTDDCAPYCWRLVQIGEHTTKGYYVPSVIDETHCKRHCSNSSNCIAIDWTGNCYLMDPTDYYATYPGTRHWEIERNLPTNCQTNSAEYFTYTSTVRTVEVTSSTVNVSTTSNSVTSVYEYTNYSKASTTGSSINWKTGFIVLAVLLGLCVLTIIGLILNTIRNGRIITTKSDATNGSTEMSDNNYEGIQRADRSVEALYTDLHVVQGNSNYGLQTNK